LCLSIYQAFVTCMMKYVKQGLIACACVIRVVKAKVCAFTRVILYGKAQAEKPATQPLFEGKKELLYPLNTR
jgi:hypothetical protein